MPSRKHLTCGQTKPEGQASLSAGGTIPEGMAAVSSDYLPGFPPACDSWYHSLFENNPEAIFLLDGQGQFSGANPAAERLCGFDQEELRKMTFADLCADESRSKALFFFARAMAGLPRDVQLVAICRDGAQIDVVLSATPVRQSSGIAGLFCTVRDVTRQNRVEVQLRQACQEAERAKDHFLAVLSHELRTPLMPVLTTVQMLEAREGASTELKEQLVMMRRNLELEARLIDDLLDLNRIRHGKLRLYLQNEDLHKKIRNVIELCHGDIVDKQLKIHLELEATDPAMAVDPARMRQVLWNIINNAVKFTPAGGSITVRTCNCNGTGACLGKHKHCVAQSMTRPSTAQMLVIHVIDTGIGIEPRELHRLFDAFERAGKCGRNFGGAGVGLAISKALVELHGGDLTAHSEGRGKGAVFTVMLPQRRLETVERVYPKAAEPSRDQRHHRLLLVEDHSDTAKVLTRLLKGFGFDVSVAHSVQAATRLADEKRFDILISDIGLPDGTGADVVQSIHRRYPIPAIALSGYGMEEDIGRSRQAGFADHLVKPINLQQLQATINRLLSRPN